MTTKDTDAAPKVVTPKPKADPVQVEIVQSSPEAPAEKAVMPKAIDEPGADTGQPSPLVNDTKATPSAGDGTSATGPRPAPVAPPADLAAKGEKTIFLAAKDAPQIPYVITVNGDRLEIPVDKEVVVTEPFLALMRDNGVAFREV